MVAETVMTRRPNLLTAAALAFRVAAAVAVAKQPSLLHQPRLHQWHSPHVTMSGSWPNADGTDGTDEWQEDSPPDLSVVPASAAHADQLASNAVLGEVEHLIADWQEAQALAGNDGVGDGAAAMMADWRRFLSDREAELRSSRKRELGPDAWVPAHLTGYFIDEKKGTFEDLEEEESAQARRNHVDVAEGFDDDADASFVFEWQLHAEREREKAASKHAPRSASAAAVGLTVKPEQGTLCIGIDLGTTNCAAAVVGANGRPYLIPMEGDAPVFPSIVAYVQQQQHKVGADANLYSAAAEGAAGAAAKDPKNAKGTRASALAVGALVGERARAAGEQSALHLLVDEEDHRTHCDSRRAQSTRGARRAAQACGKRADSPRVPRARPYRLRDRRVGRAGSQDAPRHRGPPRCARQQRRRHSARVLWRERARGHANRVHARRASAGGAAPRARGGGALLRAGQEGRREGPRIRSGRRHL